MKIEILKFFILIATFAFSASTFAKKSNQISGENFSLEITIQGDLTEKYSISGLINGNAEAESEIANSKCSLKLKNRKVLRNSAVQLELWPTLKCTIEGQIKIFQLNRMFVGISEKPVYNTIRSIAPDIKKIDFVLSNLSFSK